MLSLMYVASVTVCVSRNVFGLTCKPGTEDTCKNCLFPGCNCTNANNCPECFDGFFKDGYLCRLCLDTCLTCSTNTSCLSCQPGYNGTKCENMIQCAYNNCYCNRTGQCVACKDGFYNTSNSCLNKCNPMCASCSDENTCNTCQHRKYGPDLVDGTCSCLANFTGMNCDICVTGNYGPSCELTCAPGCNNSGCNKVDGSCLCLVNYTGIKCDKCTPGQFGSSCERTCLEGCYNSVCNRSDGSCECLANVIGNKCKTAVATTENDLPIALIAGIVVACVLALVVGIGFLVYCRKRRRQSAECIEHEMTQHELENPVYATVHKNRSVPSL